jgi:hypothetical protein
MTAHRAATLAIVTHAQLAILVHAIHDLLVTTAHRAATLAIVTHAKPETLVHAMTGHRAAILATATLVVTTALLATIRVSAALTMHVARPQTRRLSSKTRF